MYNATCCWANFCLMVYYGHPKWPSYSFWIIPGIITDKERF